MNEACAMRIARPNLTQRRSTEAAWSVAVVNGTDPSRTDFGSARSALELAASSRVHFQMDNSQDRNRTYFIGSGDCETREIYERSGRIGIKGRQLREAEEGWQFGQPGTASQWSMNLTRVSTIPQLESR